MTFILFGCYQISFRQSEQVFTRNIYRSRIRLCLCDVCTVGSKKETTSENLSILHFSNIVHYQNNNLSGSNLKMCTGFRMHMHFNNSSTQAAWPRQICVKLDESTLQNYSRSDYMFRITWLPNWWTIYTYLISDLQI